MQLRIAQARTQAGLGALRLTPSASVSAGANRALDPPGGLPAQTTRSYGASVGVGYELDGKRIERFPFTMGAQAKIKPVWETFEGWSDSTRGARSFAELPATCIKYVRRVEELVGCPVALLSTSPEREDTILMTDPFRD